MGGTPLDHVVVPLGPMHARAVAVLARRLAPVVGPSVCVPAVAHLTLVSFRGLARPDAVAALRPVAVAAAPFAVHAHGYGVFAGDGPNRLSLHVTVVRTSALDALHQRVRAALAGGGATLDGVTEPAVWTPHVTLLGEGLTPAVLARAIELLVARPHPSWDVEVAAMAVSRPDEPPGGDMLTFRAGAAEPPLTAPASGRVPGPSSRRSPVHDPNGVTGSGAPPRGPSERSSKAKGG
jgi:2'-5' RNA ligase